MSEEAAGYEVFSDETIWGMADEDWEHLITYLGAAYRPRVEYNPDPLSMAIRTIQEMKVQIGAALARIEKSNPPAHIAELVDFARTGDLRP